MNDFNELLDEITNCFTAVNNKKAILSDVLEYEDGYEILSDIPGVNKELIQIEFANNSLNINVLTKEDGENADYKLHERTHAFAPKSIYFDSEVDSDKATAKYENGVLSIYLPKMPKKNTSIKID